MVSLMAQLMELLSVSATEKKKGKPMVIHWGGKMVAQTELESESSKALVKEY
jgi:hypothetical protein